jgi:hypothetical protein
MVGLHDFFLPTSIIRDGTEAFGYSCPVRK